MLAKSGQTESPVTAVPRRRRIAVALAAALLLTLSAGSVLAHDETPTPVAEGGHAHGHGATDASMAEPTDAEQAAAAALLAETREGTARFADAAVAEAEGYVPLTPFAFYGVRAAHFHNQTYAEDGALLDPATS